MDREHQNKIDPKDEAVTKQTAELSDHKLKKEVKPRRTLKDIWNDNIYITVHNFFHPVLFIIGSIIYLELVIHILNYRSLDNKIIYPILLAIPIGLIIGFITGLFSKTVNKILLWSITGLICLIYCVQLVYFSVFKVFFSFQTLGMADDAVKEFGSDIQTAIKSNIGGIILLIIPLLILLLIMNQLIDYNRRGFKEQAMLIGGAGIFQVLAMVALLIFGKADYSPYDLYYKSKVQDLCGKQLGIITMTRFDVGKLIDGKDEDLVLADIITLDPSATIPTKIPTPIPAAPVVELPGKNDPDATPAPTLPPTPTPIDTSPNVMNIDFNVLADREEKETIRTLHQYFANVTPTNKNEYTGMFEGYNLIMITAEGFSPYAIHPEKTPTLHKLVNEGFVFKNFYTALWYTSTSDGEYVAMTGLIPDGTRSMYNGRDNLWPFSMGHQFNLLGVDSKAYHNHTYTYYQRNETHPNLGYNFIAKGNGLELEHPDVWPGSDLEMIESTVDQFVNEDRFHIYYLTVSGHMNYTFMGNSMSYKNRELVADLPYSDDVKAYIACQMELDKALELLIDKLEQAGVADRTVIALSADHYPYGWEKYKLDEIAGHEVDPYFEVYRNNFILWNAGMKEPILIEEPCSSMDIIPTLSNLFGLEYDSRLLMGQDILSDAPPLVFLSNRSFITEHMMYNSETGEAIRLTDQDLPEDYISTINKIIRNKFAVSKSILEEDYYRHVFTNDTE